MDPIRTAATALAALWLVTAAVPAPAGGRTVVGTVTKLDPAAGKITVTDGKGVPWNFKAGRGSGIELSRFAVGETVRVEIARATPLNMMSAADILRKGDTVTSVRRE